MADDFKVYDRSEAVSKMAQDYDFDVLDALVGGTVAMRRAGKKYLPQFPSEAADAYNARLSTAVLFNAFGHTSNVLSAKPFSRPMKIGGVAKQIEALFPNVDMYGTDLQSFCGQIMLACLRKGLHGVLADVPKADDIRTKAEEQKAGVRPYLAHYPVASILGWRSERKADGSYLTQLRLFETVTEPNGNWGDQLINQVRVLAPGAWQTWRKVGSTDEWKIFEEGATSLDVVPFVFFYGLQEGYGIGKPPLLDLAHMNVEHWQNSSDQQNILHVARVPILFGKGFGPNDTIVIGASQAAQSSNAESDLKYVEHSGAAIGAGRQSLLDLEDRMRQTGAELLIQRPSITTATQIQSEDEANRSTLQAITENFEDSLETCLKLMGLWVKEQSNPKVELYKNFGSALLGEKGGDLLLRAAKDGYISSETVFDQLQRADVVPADASWKDEQKRLDTDAEAKAKRAGKEVAEIGVPPKATLIEAPPT